MVLNDLIAHLWHFLAWEEAGGGEYNLETVSIQVRSGEEGEGVITGARVDISLLAKQAA